MFDHDYKSYPELTNAELEVLGFSSPHKQITEDFYARVVKVHDGDTVTLSVDFRSFDFPLRFADIDAPELSQGGDFTRDWLSGKILGCEVFVMIDSFNRVDKHGRLLGRVFYNGMNLGDEMLQLGLVVPYGFKNEGFVPDIDRVLREGEVSE